ncbi:hypothetical protein Angca_007744 [Angiostrongylus cantonensis]|nr:hypothetical protein Angca_007744 [Angiostrongylus cantonensis]
MEFEPFGVEMDTMPYSRLKPYQIKLNDQFLQISSKKKESEIGGPMEAFYREQEQPPLSPSHTLIEITTGSTAPINKTTSGDFAASTNPLTKSRTTTPELTEILQTTSISPSSEAFKHPLSAEISYIPVSSTVEKDCSVHAESRSGSGIYPVSPHGGESFMVYCDQETDGGGWTVIQRRTGPTVYFYNRTWHEYEEGFGDIKGSYWLGLMNIHRLAPHTMDSWTLRIELHGDTCSGQGCVKENNGFWWAEWPFKLGDSSSMYVIELGPVLRGNLTSPDSTDYLMESNGYPFTTIDRDNDAAGLNCAQFRNYGGWWHSSCGHVALNGIYGDTEPSHRYMVYTYSGSKTRNKKYFIHPKKSVMMIRPSTWK